MKPGRNDVCPCGSGKKYKKCCLEKDELARAAARAEETARAASAPATEDSGPADANPTAAAKGAKVPPKQERNQAGPRTAAPPPSPLRRRSV